MSHLHRNWRRKWTINVAAREAHHTAGVSVTFHDEGDRWGVQAICGTDAVHPGDLAKMLDQAKSLFLVELAVDSAILSHLPKSLIRAAYRGAPGDELAGKFASPESSAALAANAFGLFLDGGVALESLGPRRTVPTGSRVTLEAIVRFPWRGGRHPCLDALVEAGDTLIGIESKRYEPFRGPKAPEFSEIYLRTEWAEGMRPYVQVCQALSSGQLTFSSLDAAQLIKHAFGLSTAVRRQDAWQGWRGRYCCICSPSRELGLMDHRSRPTGRASIVSRLAGSRST